MSERRRPLIEVYERVTGRKAVLFGSPSPSETMTFTVTPLLGVTSGIISGVRVQDVALGKWFNWDRPGPFVPSAPIVTPGAGNLYIALWAVNQGTPGNLTLTITDDTGAVLATKTYSAEYGGGGVGLEWTGAMPGRNYGITLTVTP